MSAVDWSVLAASLAFIVAYGAWKTRRTRNMDDFLLAGRELGWPAVTLSIMATQASAITFLSTPGQAYVDGLRFVQFYLGLPLAMVVLSATAVPIYFRLKVYTAYEYLESRFDLKTRALAAFLFLAQRGLAAGLTIYAPSLILSVLLGWNIYWTNLAIGSMVIVYTTVGGAKAVGWTQLQQMLIITGGMAGAFAVVVYLLPDGVSFLDSLKLAGKFGRLEAIDFSFDLQNRYNLWSGLIGGFFLALSYFGTDHSQVQRYLSGRSVAQSRLGLLGNGLVKVPMQFLILLLGVMVFVFYQFTPPPLCFNPVQAARVRQGPAAGHYKALEDRFERQFVAKRASAHRLLAAMESGTPADVESARKLLRQDAEASDATRREAFVLIRQADPASGSGDTNYIFLNFVIHYLPVGLVGLVLAAIFAASMSSTAAELNALAATTYVDVARRLAGHAGDASGQIHLTRVFTAGWGAVAIGFACFAHHLGTLIEAVNILGSLFYGTILGIFLVAFYLKRVTGPATFYAALVAEAAVLGCFLWSDLSYLWFNVVGCLLVMLLAPLVHWLRRK